jgi:fructose-1,6-bisphosphatase/inositol monophosphatase family enzyme
VTVLTTIERAAVDGHRRSVEAVPPTDAGADDVALYLGIRLLLEAGRLVRERRAEAGRAGVTIKEDGSPATEIEHQIESKLRSWLSVLGSDAVVVGEETGGVLPVKGTAFAIDPIDGTRAFLAETETYSTTLALIRDGEATLGMVANPSVGEIAYATAGGASRLIRLSTFGEPDEVSILERPSTPERPLLINIHPNRRGAAVVNALYCAWEQRDIAMVRSPGGSPAWALVEAARGHFAYVNLWSKRPPDAFDLAAAVLIVRRAGGEVSDLDGEPIDALRHRGPFVAGMDSEIVSRVTEVVRGSLDDSEMQ